MYRDRIEAAEKLCHKLTRYKQTDSVVLGLPRGGVVVAAVVANFLESPLGAVIVKKITLPSYSEYAVGALAEEAKPILNDQETRYLSKESLNAQIDSARRLIDSRLKNYFLDNDISRPTITDKTAIIVDDGIATGFTMQAAVQSVAAKKPKKLIIAVPTASPESILSLKELADEIIVDEKPSKFLGAVGAHYDHFPQTKDNEVIDLLSRTK